MKILDILYITLAMNSNMLIKYLAAVSLLLICYPLVDGFSTNKCEHNQVVAQMKDFLKCGRNTIMKYSAETPLYRYYVGMALPVYPVNKKRMCSYLQNTVKEGILCANSFAETCFEPLVSKADSVFEGDCDPSPVNDHKLRAFMDMVQKIFGRPRMHDAHYLDPVIKFDKNCSLDQRAGEMEKGPLDCFKKKLEKNFRSSSVHLADCNAVIDVLASCFKSNNCFSQLEMDFARDMVFTIYDTTMEQYSIYIDNFQRSLQTEFSKQILDGIKATLDDYESDNCKTKIKASPVVLLAAGTSRQSISKLFVMMLSVLLLKFK